MKQISRIKSHYVCIKLLFFKSVKLKMWDIKISVRSESIVLLHLDIFSALLCAFV